MAANRGSWASASAAIPTGAPCCSTAPARVVKVAARQDDAMSRWINDLVQRRNPNIAAVAVANKNARTSWALLTRDEDYRAPVSQAA